jgi:SpoVK/Ycf46/Vps4 family AAA+-type ATPase
VFFVGTSNDISKLPPEFTRAERFDGVFFLDLPNVGERDAIWSLYRQQFGIPETQSRPDDTSWTGAEVKACCRLAALLDITLHQAAFNIVPVAVTAAESVEKLRNWASGRCLCANNPGVFSRNGAQPQAKAARRIQRSSDN